MRWYGYHTHSKLVKGYFLTFTDWDQYLLSPYNEYLEFPEWHNNRRNQYYKIFYTISFKKNK